jgi:dsDNA-specific endonuclease/ATPase MutS2
MIGFTQEQERLRQEAERVAREAAEKEAERLRRRAEKARDKGQDDKATDLEEQAEEVPVPIVPSQVPTAHGVAFRTTWRAEVHDLKALVTACAKGQAPLALLEPNMPVLNTQARSLKKELNIPGVRAVSDEGVAARGS